MNDRVEKLVVKPVKVGTAMIFDREEVFFCVRLIFVPSVISPFSLSSVEHVKFYRKEDIPGHFHYRDNDRIPPIMGFADLGWAVRLTNYV